MIPFIIKVKLFRQDRKSVRLFIPLIPFWILFFALMVVLLPFVMFAAIILRKRGYAQLLLRICPMIFSLLFSLSGLSLLIEKREKKIELLFA